MIDPQVAFDKLAQFETADELADFFRSEGVKAYPGKSKVCAVSLWMHKTTGFVVSTSKHDMLVRTHENPYTHTILDNTPAMSSFISRFDDCMYPDLFR